MWHQSETHYEVWMRFALTEEILLCEFIENNVVYSDGRSMGCVCVTHAMQLFQNQDDFNSMVLSMLNNLFLFFRISEALTVTRIKIKGGKHVNKRQRFKLNITLSDPWADTRGKDIVYMHINKAEQSWRLMSGSGVQKFQLTLYLFSHY